MPQGLNIGSLLDHGKYRVEKVLGQGGFGITYLVTDLGLDKKRAVKEFFPKDYCERNKTTSHVSLGTSNTSGFVERLKAKFIKEARNIANLDQHHGIIRIHTVFEENNTAYYIMDYIDGESLSAMVKRSGPIPVEKAIKYIKAVGEALSYVHSHNINHLDIKPANIMIRKKDDKPILIDFGLAKQYDSDGLQTSTTPTGISHGFAPFEQYRDGGIKEFSPQTDVYSLAATLYYIISGQVPPHSTDLIENELPFPPSFPVGLQAPIRKAMSTKRQSRPETVLQFLDSLDSTSIGDENTIVAIPIDTNGKTGTDSRKAKEEPSKDSSVGEKVVSRDDRNKTPNSKRKRRYNFPAYFRKHAKQIRNWGIVTIFILAVVGTSKIYNASAADDRMTQEQEVAPEAPGAEESALLDSEAAEAPVKGDGYTTTPSGLKYKVLKKGNGKKPSATDVVVVNYEGKLTDGTKFDSSYDRGEPATFPLNRVIPGWTEGVQLMPEGSVYEFYIPYELAYGKNGAGPIPPMSDLIFKVELIKVQ